jgi:hypothetical protein
MTADLYLDALRSQTLGALLDRIRPSALGDTHRSAQVDEHASRGRATRSEPDDKHLAPDQIHQAPPFEMKSA